MNYEDRFYKCDGFGFPEVTQYDYETNLPVRGSDNRDFRWEDVSVESNYLFKEATSGDFFESNTYVIPTGIPYITTITGVDSGTFPGWTASGSATLYIGLSGIELPSGSLPVITTDVVAHPIYGDHAIGLLCLSGSNFPSITSWEMSTGDEGPIIPNGNHQVYVQGKRNLGQSGYLRVVVRGWHAGEVVAFYNPLSSAWEATLPTSGYSIADTGYTTVKYDFTASNFPAVTPSSYDLYIDSIVSGSLLTVDNAHIDAYFKKNAFVDYIVPSGYMIQFSPDLGWHDITSHFNNSVSISNPYLKSVGPFAVENGNLVDNLDNSVTATIDEAEFLQVVTDTYSKYLWRVLAISEDGTLGPGGLPQRFTYAGNLSKYFSVDEIIDEQHLIKLITGKKSPNMKVLVDGLEDNPNLVYPTTTSWKLTVNMSSPSRSLTIQGKDASGATSVLHTISLVDKLHDQNSRAIWNVFDEHGLVADIERLEEESNYNYSNRIKNRYREQPGSNFVGIVNGAITELDLNKISDGLTLRVNKNEFGQLLVDNADIEVTSYSLRIRTPSMVITEILPIDPIYNTITLAKLPYDTPTFTLIQDNKKINENDISVVAFTAVEQGRYKYRVEGVFTPDTFISVQYKHYEEFLFKDYRDLHSMTNAVNALADHTGTNVMHASISGKLSGNENCFGLYLAFKNITDDAISIAWTPVFLKKISDEGYKDYFISGNSSLRETEYYSFVEELKNKTNIFWGSVETDRAVWDAADFKDLGMDAIPTLFDPPLTHFVSLKSGELTRIEAVNSWARGYMGFNSDYISNIGLSNQFLHPGVGHKNDLTPSIYITSSTIINNTNSEINIGPVKQDNTVIIFSGQL